jgi:hypothetical protein
LSQWFPDADQKAVSALIFDSLIDCRLDVRSDVREFDPAQKGILCGRQPNDSAISLSADMRSFGRKNEKKIPSPFKRGSSALISIPPALIFSVQNGSGLFLNLP